MVRHFDPGTGADRSVAHARVPFPVRQSGVTSPRPKTLRSARNIMQTWDQEVAEFEMKFAEKVDEDATIAVLKSIMPKTLFGEAGVFRGRSFNLYADLRTAIINSLDDKAPVSMTKLGSGCRRVARKQKAARILHGRGKSSQRRPRKSTFKAGRQTGCWRRMQRHHEPR